MILSNAKLDHSEIAVVTPDGDIPTGLRKFGAIVGDRTNVTRDGFAGRCLDDQPRKIVDLNRLGLSSLRLLIGPPNAFFILF